MTEHKKSRVAILSLGCPRNLVDSESILGRLKTKGYPLVDIDKADVVIVNTCAFIDDAKEESIGAILDLIELKKEGRLKKIIVCGCLTERYKDRLKEQLPEVDAFVGVLYLTADLKSFRLTPAHYAYLKICEGCINNCSYCVVPKIKKGFHSVEINALLERVRIFDRNNIRELNIIGQDITGYGIDLYKDTKLASLIEKIISRTKNIRWLRLLYLYPARITDELLELIGKTPRVCKYIDLPLQHINSRILKLMRRDTTKTDILRLVAKIRKKIPGVAIRTSFIVGFPSETDGEFQELLYFIEEVKFERLGAFIYSREEGTSAYAFKEQIPHKTKLERLSALMSRQQAVSRDINQRFLGQIMEILIDEKEEGFYLGRSQYDAPEVDGLVYVNSKETLRPGDFVKVKITDTLEYDLVGEVYQ
jgi:ribosomal protein S12 methylthiotransferase